MGVARASGPQGRRVPKASLRRTGPRKLITSPSLPPPPPLAQVVVSSRLLDSPCALSTSKFGWSANMERIMKTQAMGDSRAMDYMRGRKVLEVNPRHDIVRGIKASTCVCGGGGYKGACCVLCR